MMMADATKELDRTLRRDLKLLARFIGVYCDNRHQEAARAPAQLKTHDIEALMGSSISLCEECTRLLAHAFSKRSTCPMDPKPPCKNCLDHCYHPVYREHIREVMKYSGKKLVLSGRLDYLFQLLF